MQDREFVHSKEHDDSLLETWKKSPIYLYLVDSGLAFPKSHDRLSSGSDFSLSNVQAHCICPTFYGSLKIQLQIW